MNYVGWALTGMAGYSLVTLLVKLATRDGQFSPFLVLAIATVIVALTAIALAVWRGDTHVLTWRVLLSSNALLTYATGIALCVAVTSLFRALSLGPASVVVPVYGMFIVGGSILGVLFLGENVSARKLIGVALAVVAVFLIAGSKTHK